MKTDKQRYKRNELIDILRGIGIIAVVLGHALVSGNYYSDMADYIVLCVFGRYSFWIMCGHIMVFKVIDGITGIFLNTDSLTLQQFPWTFPELRGIYLIAGVIIPVIIGEAVEKAKVKLRGV